MVVRGGSPVNGALSGRAGPMEEKTESNQFLLPPSADGLKGRPASSAVGPAAPLPAAAGPGCPLPLLSSSGRSGRPSSTELSDDRRSFAFSAAVASLRRATSESLGQAGLLADAPSFWGGGRLRAWRHHQRCALAIFDAFLAPLEAHLLHESPEQLGIDRLIVITGVLGKYAARAGSHCKRHGQNAGKGSRALPVRVPVAHSYPPHAAAQCAASPGAIWPGIRALLRRRRRPRASHTGALPPRRQWPHLRG